MLVVICRAQLAGISVRRNSVRRNGVLFTEYSFFNRSLWDQSNCDRMVLLAVGICFSGSLPELSSTAIVAVVIDSTLDEQGAVVVGADRT